MHVCERKRVNEHDSVLKVHSIELKFGMHITGERRTNPLDFGECRIYMYIYFFKAMQKRILMYYGL